MMLTDAQIEWLREHLKTFRAFWQRADGSHVELVSVGTHAEEPNLVAYVAQPPGGYIALDNVTRGEILPTGIRKSVPVFAEGALDAETQAKIARGELTVMRDDTLAKAPTSGPVSGDPGNWIGESARAIHTRAGGALNWIVVPDAAYAALAAEAARAEMDVDTFVLHTLTQRCVSLPNLGKPFKVFRASDLKSAADPSRKD